MGCPYAPLHLDVPYVWMHPVCLDAPYMFGCTPCMFGCPHVWTLAVCLDAPMFGHHPYIWMPPICLDALLYIWMPPVCLVAPICVALLAKLVSVLQCLDTPCMF